MKISVSFNDLYALFNTVKMALNQKAIKEENRKVTLQARNGVLTMGSFTALVSARGSIEATIDGMEEEGKGTGESITLKSTDLGNILSVFMGMSKTHATEVDIEDIGNGRCRIIVHEEANDPEDGDLSNSSVFTLMSQTVPKQQIEFLTQDFPEEGESVNKEELVFATSALMKQMSGEINSKNNLLNFDANYLFVTSESLVVTRNNLVDDKEVLSGFSLSHHQVGILQALLGTSGELRVARNERTIYVFTDEYQITFQVNRMDTRAVKNNILGSKFDHSVSEGSEGSDGGEAPAGMVMNRPYFLDLLKRAELSGKTVSLVVKEEELTLVGTGASDFEQVVPLHHLRGVDNISFTLPVSVLTGSVLNNPLLDTEELFLYVYDTPKATQKKILLMDSTDSWMSVLIVPVKNL